MDLSHKTRHNSMSHWISKSTFKKDNIRDNCKKYIFRGIFTTKSHSKLRACDRDVSCICAWENVSRNYTDTFKKDGYIQESFEAELVVAKNLGY